MNRDNAFRPRAKGIVAPKHKLVQPMVVGFIQLALWYGFY